MVNNTQRENQQSTATKKTPSNIVGGLFRAVFTLIGYIFKFLWFLTRKMGLMVPALYAVFGVVLWAVLDFNPLDFSTSEGTLYLVGFGASCLCSAIITVYNFIVKPIKGVAEGYKNPFWKKPAPAPRVVTEQIEPTTERVARGGYTAPAMGIRPKIYFSELEKGSIIHEYPDRFEVYVMVGGKEVLDKVEYRNE